MKKDELGRHLKRSTENINEFLRAAGIPMNKAEFTPKEVKCLEEISELLRKYHSKSYKAAQKILRRQKRRADAMRVSIPLRPIPSYSSEWDGDDDYELDPEFLD